MGPASKEICGGPHASNTAELVSFKIQKEESSSAGVRRIKAVIGAKPEDSIPPAQKRSRACPANIAGRRLVLFYPVFLGGDFLEVL